MGNRGRERQVNCEKCGRSVRKDKAVFIEKPILQNPLERHQLAEPSTYRAVLTREVAYCPGCGKHLRVYEKKIKQNIRNDEREARQREFGDRRFPPRHHDRPRDVQGDQGGQGGASSQGNAQSSEQGGTAQSGESGKAADAAASTEGKEAESGSEIEESEVPAENRESGQGGSEQGGQ